MYKISENDFTKVEIIYKTNTIEIFKAKLNQNGREIAVKKIRFNTINDINCINNELFMMASLKHPNVVELLSYKIITGPSWSNFLIITDSFPNGDLQNLIMKKSANGNKFIEEDLLFHYKALIDVHCYLQNQNAIHGYINPENIWISNDGSLKVTNFSCSAKFSENKGKVYCPIRENQLYLSPKLRQAYINYLNGGEAGFVMHDPWKSDVYSLGLVFLYMASLKELSELSDLRNHEYKVWQKIQEIHYSNIIKQILGYMLIFDEDRRPDFLALSNAFLPVDISYIQPARLLSRKLKATEVHDWANISSNIKIWAKHSLMKSILLRASADISSEMQTDVFIFKFIVLAISMNANIKVDAMSYKCIFCSTSNANGFFSCHRGYFHQECAKNYIRYSDYMDTRKYFIYCHSCKKNTLLREESISSSWNSMNPCASCNQNNANLFFFSCSHMFCVNCLVSYRDVYDKNCLFCTGTCNIEEKQKFLERNLK